METCDRCEHARHTLSACLSQIELGDDAFALTPRHLAPRGLEAAQARGQIERGSAKRPYQLAADPVKSDGAIGEPCHDFRLSWNNSSNEALDEAVVPKSVDSQRSQRHSGE